MQVYAIGLGVGTRNRKGEWLEVFYPRPAAVAHPHAVAGSARRPRATAATSTSRSLLTLAAEYCARPGRTTTPRWPQRLATSERPCVGDRARTLMTRRPPRVPAGIPQAAPAVAPPGAARTAPTCSGVFRRAAQRRLDQQVALIDLGRAGRDSSSTPACTARPWKSNCVDKFPQHDRLRRPQRACASQTPPGCASAPTSARAPRSCTRAFINFNAGTVGPGMIEGRVSAGVAVGAQLRPRRRLHHHGHPVRRWQ